MAAVADDHFFDFFETAFVDQHPTNRRLARNFRACWIEAQDIARLDDYDLLADDGSLFHKFGVTVKLAIGSVNGDEIFGLHQCHDQLQFFFAGMTAHMHRRLASVGVIDLRAPAIEMIHHPADRAFVSWNVARGQDNRVAFLDLEILMVVERQPGKRRHWFSLTSTGNNTNFVARIAANFFRSNDQPRRNFQEAKFFGSLGVFDHPASEKAHAASILLRLIDYQLKPWNR